jgi:hypothetical protein
MTSSTRVPLIGLWHDDRHRYYWMGEGPWPGGSSLTEPADDKEGLIRWAKNEVARCALDNFDFLNELVVRGGRENAMTWVAGIPDFKRDTAADLGSAVHRIAEAISRGEKPEVTEEQREYVAAYQRFLADYQPNFESLEQKVCNVTHRYGGKYDAIARINGKRTLIDYKTSRTLHPKIAIQLAAYAGAEFVGRTDDPRKYGQSKLGLSKFQDFAVLHIRPEQYAKGYRLVRFKVTEDDFEAAIHALALIRWRKTSKNVIGESIYPEIRQEQAA